MSFKPTQEQVDILGAFKANRVLKVNAVAGSGKTSTLKLLAEDNKVPSLYISFNKAIAEEAQGKFPQHVECRTSHSLAYAQYGKYIQHKLKRPVVKYKNVAGTSAEIAKFYYINDMYSDNGPVSSTAIASLVKETVKRFQNSADDKILALHTPYSAIKEIEKNHAGLDVKAMVVCILDNARKLWRDRINPMSEVLCTPDTYLKLYQLSKPVLNFDIIYLDESQDSNPALLDIVTRQTHCKIAYVGDTYQSIYQFRGAVNAMEMIGAPSKYLSKSFRYGETIAEVAKYIISEAIDVKGNDSISSSIVQDVDWKENEYTYIFRTNGCLLETAVDMIAEGHDVHIDIDTKNFIKQLESAEALKYGDSKKVKHEDITPYSSWYDLLQASKEDPELRRLVRIIEGKKVGSFISSLNQLSSKEDAKVFMTTAHKSKGCEWSNVYLANDFPLRDKDGNTLDKMNQAEINLLYVACTRAINKLKLPSLLEDKFKDRV